MALIKRVVITEKRVCLDCKKEIKIGEIALKDRRQKYKITPKTKDKPKKVEHFYDEPTQYHHIECFKK